MIWVLESHFPNHYPGWNIANIDAYIGEMGLDLREDLVHYESKVVWELVLGIGKMEGITCQFHM
jgi:hypothetical protein